MLEMASAQLNRNSDSGPSKKKLKAARKLNFSDLIIDKNITIKNGTGIDNTYEQLMPKTLPDIVVMNNIGYSEITVNQNCNEVLNTNIRVLQNATNTMHVEEVQGTDPIECLHNNPTIFGNAENIGYEISEQKFENQILDGLFIPLSNVGESQSNFATSDDVWYESQTASCKATTKFEDITEEYKENYEIICSGDDIDPNYEPSTSSSNEEDSQGNVVNGITGDVQEPTSSNAPLLIRDSRSMRQDRKTKRNKGEQYITESGKTVKARIFQRLANCRMKCASKISEGLQSELFETYWRMESRNRRASYISGLISFSKPSASRKRRNTPEKQKNREVTFQYRIPVNGETILVCKKCFLQIFDETPKFLWILAMQKKASPISNSTPDKRGRREPPNKFSASKVNEVKEHLASLPSYESHYCRKETNKMYLPPHYTITKIYKKYCELSDSPVSFTIYSKMFRESNYSIKNPKKDTCQTCDKLKIRVNYAEEKDKSEILEQQINHHSEAELAYETKRADKIKAKADADITVLSFDLQQCLPTPSPQTSVAFYKRQLWTFNLTAHNMQNDQATCFVWYETIAKRGANEIASCMFKAITNLQSNIKHVILYSDCCPGQNKNTPFLAMCLSIINNNNIEILDHKFMVPGHSRMECDSDHAQIEKLKKRFETPITHPHDWMQLIRMAGRKNPFQVIEMKQPDFFNYASLLKTKIQMKKCNEDGDKFVWHNVKWLRYCKTEQLKVFYKTSLKERRGNSNPCLTPSICYNTLLPISLEKKKDILSLLPYIPPVFHGFYKSLPTSSVNIDPMVDSEEDD